MTCHAKLIRIPSVDDHALLRHGIASLVNGEPDMEPAAQGLTGREAIGAIPAT